MPAMRVETKGCLEVGLQGHSETVEGDGFDFHGEWRLGIGD